MVNNISYQNKKRMSHIVTTQLEEVLTTQTLNLYDHLKIFMKLEVENRTKVELRHS